MPGGKHSGHPPPPPRPPEHGPRRARLEDRKKGDRRTRTLLGTVSIVVGVVVGLVFVILVAREVTRTEDPPPVRTENEVRTSSLTLLFGTDTSNRGQEMLVWASLLVHDPEEQTSAVAYIPARTAVEVPGRGLQALNDSWKTGGIPLLLVTVENLLGAPVDNYLQLAENDALALFEEVGELEVDVPTEVRVPIGPSQVRLLFPTGEQTLSAEGLTDLLYVRGVDGDDVEMGGRHIAFWHALLETYAEDPQGLEDAALEARGALGKSDARAREIAALLGDVAATHEIRRSLMVLPVSPLEVPGNNLYVAEPADVAQLLEDLALTDQAPAAARVQILNGNGVPGIGQEVATRLVGEGFRVILSGNAPRLNYARTLVIVYDDTEDSRALAERARELIGVGEIQMSAQEQGIVDLTIVVGKDFLRTP